jgi:hypothetical protein
MKADLMHAQIDRQNYVILERYGNRYQLENSSGRIDHWNELETTPIEAPWPLD